jgi:hypothetical protein
MKSSSVPPGGMRSRYTSDSAAMVASSMCVARRGTP